MTLAAQLSLPPLQDARFRPTVSIETARVYLDEVSLHVRSLIDDGDLEWAWDVSTHRARRRYVRILRRCLEGYLAKGSRPESISQDAVWRSLLPPGHTKPFLSTPELERALNVERDLILDLIEAGELALLANTKPRRGQNGEALVTVESFKAFLGGRRIGRNMETGR